MGHILEIIVLLYGLAVATCEVDLRGMLDRAAHRMARNTGATLNHYRLDQGICVEDLGPESECWQGPNGETPVASLLYSIAQEANEHNIRSVVTYLYLKGVRDRPQDKQLPSKI